MRKRTNPLELMGSGRSESRRSSEPAEKNISTEPTKQNKPASSSGVSAPPSRSKNAAEFAPPRVVPITTEPKQPAAAFVPKSTRELIEEYTKPRPAPVVEQAPPIVDPEAYDEQEEDMDLYAEPELPEAEPVLPPDKNKTADARSTGELIEDEREFPTMEDFQMSARFSLCGRVARKTLMCRVSSDFCRLAKLMHPGESLSQVIENALLTRIFLENPEAFDSLAVVIEEKGGRIKC